MSCLSRRLSGRLPGRPSRRSSRTQRCRFTRHPALVAKSVATLAICVLWWTPLALAQHDGGDGRGAPRPPAGNGVLNIQVRHATTPNEAAGLSIALYALAPDGSPGLANGQTDAQGRFSFEGISTDPEIVYLIGASYREIPFGQRITFAPGATTARVEIEISDPTDRLAGVEVQELRARIDWRGDRIVVRETLRIINPGDRVILLSGDDRSRAITSRQLGPAAQDFSPGLRSISGGLGFEDGVVRFWGPLYPGEQRIDYEYSLPIEDPGLTLPVEMREALGRVVIVAGTPGIEVAGPELVASSQELSESGQPLSAWTRSGLRGAQRLDVALTFPELRRDPGLITIPRADIWLELDDTRLTATLELNLEVAPGSPVAGTPEAPLFHVPLPIGATMSGTTPKAEALGLVPTADAGFDVIGPIAPGTTSLGYSYQLPARPEGVDLGLRFPLNVETLNVMIADTGLALDSGRLHRRRPFRSGTRNYLHREAYNVSPEEVVDLELVPLRAAGLPRPAAMALTIAAAAGGVVFLAMPLFGASRRQLDLPAKGEPIGAEREALYEAIRDLDHDFETGKLEAVDHRTMRKDLRERAIALLRKERAPAMDSASAQAIATASEVQIAPASRESSASRAAASSPGGTQPAAGGYCTGCGAQVESKWRFCSRCGGPLEQAPEAGG